MHLTHKSQHAFASNRESSDSVTTFLETLERGGLIQRDPEKSGTYSFRHVLMQDAAYSSLLRNDRRQLHRLTARTLERDHAADLDAIAALLAYHYDGADDEHTAMTYALCAGDAAARVFANVEALAHYTHAIALGERARHPLPNAFRARAQVHERHGNFDAAHADLKEALRLAQAQGDGRTEWQCLMDFGMLWASRDYAHAGAYAERALDQALMLREPSLVAYSMNRVGNWFVNTERPAEALHYHHRALEIFTEADDARGIAETYDLLGICMIIAGDTRASAAYYEKAIERFEALNERIGLISSQTAFGFLHRNYDTDLVVTEMSFSDSVVRMEQALQWAQDIEYRAGESFTAAQLGISYASQGQYARALKLAARGLELAEQIQHHQWRVGALYAMGAIHAELLNAKYAQALFERAVQLAQATRSGYWVHIMNAWLAITLIAQGQFARAHEILDATLHEDTPMQTLAQRRLWSARVLLALGEREAALALDLTERLEASAANRDHHQVIPLLGYLRGRALNQLREFERADQVLRATLAQAHAENVRPYLWRLYGTLSGALEGQARRDEAQAAFDAARTHILELAQEIPAETPNVQSGAALPLQRVFLERTLARIQAMRTGS